MKDLQSIDYSKLDRPDILTALFYPRKESGMSQSKSFEALKIPTPDGEILGGRLYFFSETAPTILFFHGNGEIVEDYDDLAEIYLRLKVNFMPVDYRGYGRSSGKPTVSSMMRDCHTIFQFAKELLVRKKFAEKLIVMGRSLGSASAIEIASEYESEIGGLIVESGFANILPLLLLLGVDIHSYNLTEEKCPSNVRKIVRYHGPLLIIHAEKDHIIPYKEGKMLFNACPSTQKDFLEIKGANHNNIFQYGATQYFNTIEKFLGNIDYRR